MSRTLEAALDEANPNKLADAMRMLPVGEQFKVGLKYYRGAVASHVMALPEDMRAAQILRCNSLAGTLTGALVPELPGATPTTGEVAVNATGNILFASADAVTQAEVWYFPLEGNVIEEEIAVTSDVGTLPSSRAGVTLLAVTALEGSPLGAFTVVNRGATPSTTQAALSALGTTIVFAGADSVTRARVKYVAAPGVGTGATPSLMSRLRELIGW